MATVYHEVIVCYDVADNKKRKLLSEKLKNAGLCRIQRSVFWGFVTQAEHHSVVRSFNEILNKLTDRAFIINGPLSKYFKGNSFNYTELDFPKWTTFESI